MYNGERLIERPLRWGMVGGGRTGQVGYKHRTGAQRDGTYKLVCDAFDMDTNRGREFGINIGVDSDRFYCSKRSSDGAFLKTHRCPDIKAGTEGVRWLETASAPPMPVLRGTIPVIVAVLPTGAPSSLDAVLPYF